MVLALSELKGKVMSEITETLEAFFKSIEYSMGTNLNVSKIEKDLYDLLKTHAVIDKETALTADTALIKARWLSSSEIIQAELSRLTSLMEQE